MTAPNRQHGKTVDEWSKMCLSKSRYADEYIARATAQHVLTAYTDVTVKRMYVYKCPSCRGWHMSKSNNGTPPVTAEALVLENA